MRTLWKITREWEGETCVLLGSGPSMTRAIADAVHERVCRTIAVNNQAIETYGHAALAPWADLLYAADAKWWMENAAAVAKYRGRKVSIAHSSGITQAAVTADTLVVGNGGAGGFDERTDHVRTGYNSGYQAVHIAIHLGARRIVLCGFDMRVQAGKEHWFGHHHWRVGHRSRYELFIKYFREAAPELLKRAEIVNATPGSALDCFPKVTLEEALNGLPVVCREAQACNGNGAQASAGIPAAVGAAPQAGASEGAGVAAGA